MYLTKEIISKYRYASLAFFLFLLRRSGEGLFKQLSKAEKLNAKSILELIDNGIDIDEHLYLPIPDSDKSYRVALPDNSEILSFISTAGIRIDITPLPMSFHTWKLTLYYRGDSMTETVNKELPQAYEHLLDMAFDTVNEIIKKEFDKRPFSGIACILSLATVKRKNKFKKRERKGQAVEIQHQKNPNLTQEVFDFIKARLIGDIVTLEPQDVPENDYPLAIELNDDKIRNMIDALIPLIKGRSYLAHEPKKQSKSGL